jgi:hypothetical protein
MQKGYNRKTANYKLIIESIFKDYEKTIINSFMSEEEKEKELEELRTFQKLMDIAFNRNKGKSPSEVDISFLRLCLERLDDKKIETIKKIKEKGYLWEWKPYEIIFYGAYVRQKPIPEQYVKRTLEKVIVYWERDRKREEEERKRRTESPYWNWSNDNDRSKGRRR